MVTNVSASFLLRRSIANSHKNGTNATMYSAVKLKNEDDDDNNNNNNNNNSIPSFRCGT